MLWFNLTWQLNPMHLSADFPGSEGWRGEQKELKWENFWVEIGGLIGKAEAVCPAKLFPLSLYAEPCAVLSLLSCGQRSQLCPLTNPCALQPGGVG